jgi:hypothetical protein
MTYSKYELSRDFLVHEYIENKKSCYEIAQMVGCCHATVNRALRLNDISRRGAVEASRPAIRRAVCTGYGEIQGAYWNSVRQSAKKRNIPLLVTIQDIWELFLRQNRKCVLTGETLTLAQCNKDHNTGNYTASLDRRDSYVPYSIDNVQWVHKLVNIMKRELSEEEFVRVCKMVAKHRRVSHS